MQVTDFRISLERKKLLRELLSRVKPRLQAIRIDFFLSECEREIRYCLKSYPSGWEVDERTPKRLESVGKAALALNVALEELNEAESQALFAGILVGHESGVDIGEVRAEARETKALLSKILLESQHLCHGVGTPVKERLAEDIASSIAISYVTAFGSLPSVRHDSAYKLFVDDLTANDLPSKFRVTIGKRKMELANQRASIFTEHASPNKTVMANKPI